MYPEMFGKNVFNDAVMRDRLPKSVYKKLKKTIEDGAELDPSIADVVCPCHEGLGNWERSHPLYPLVPAADRRDCREKHDSFISAPSDGKVIMEFSGKGADQGRSRTHPPFHPAAFRATFEARGYTVWDCTSTGLLREDAIGVTLCIPTSFCSYKGRGAGQKTRCCVPCRLSMSRH